MKNYENTFVRGPSPSYSDELTSENAYSVTLPIDAGAVDFDGCCVDSGDFSHLDVKSDTDCYFDEKFNAIYDRSPYMQHIRYGRNTFAFWTIVIILLTMTIGNLILTFTIVGVLRLGKGIQGMEVIPEVDVIKFYGNTDLDRIYMKNFGQIDGFTDMPVSFNGDDAGVYVRVYRNGIYSDRIVVDKEGIFIRNTNFFDIKDPTTQATLFTTHRPQFNIPNGVNTLQAKTISATKISSAIDQTLTIETEGRISIKGSEGITMDSAAATFQAEHHITLNTTQGGIVLEAGSGIFFDMERMPIVSSELGLRTGSVQYKLCVCMPQGILFRIAIPRIHNGPKISCMHFNASDDPCAV